MTVIRWQATCRRDLSPINLIIVSRFRTQDWPANLASRCEENPCQPRATGETSCGGRIKLKECPQLPGCVIDKMRLRKTPRVSSSSSL